MKDKFGLPIVVAIAEIRDSIDDLESLIDLPPAKTKCPWRDLFPGTKRCAYITEMDGYCENINIKTTLSDAWCTSRIRMANSIIYEMKKLKEIPE